jgi:excisionase family DNA binding protein
MGRSAHAKSAGSWQRETIVVTAIESTRSLYSVREVADRLGVHPETIRRLIHDGRLDAIRVGRVLRVDGAALEGFLARMRVKPAR